jgi:hypothetical protein
MILMIRRINKEMNKYLIKIINEYLNKKCLFENELLEKTNSIKEAEEYFWYYPKYHRSIQFGYNNEYGIKITYYDIIGWKMSRK